MFVLAVEFSRAQLRPFGEAQGFGGDGGGETPVPIPNTEVKPACADGTWVETPRESRSPPISHDERPQLRLGALSRPG